MTSRRLIPLVLLAAVLAGARARASEVTNLADRVVRIAATYQNQNPYLPWQFQAPATRIGYGILIGKNQVLTTETLVRSHTHVELRRPRSGQRVPAQVAIADPRINLALLNLPPAPGEDLPPLEAQGPLHLHESLQVVQFDDAEDVQSGPAEVIQIGVVNLPDGPYSALTYSLLTQLNVEGEGAPVLCSNRLAGLVMSYDPASRMGTVIGAPFVDRFLVDARKSPYRGPASAGFTWHALPDPAKRAWLKLGDEPNGIQVVSTLPGAGADDLLQSLDVILAWNGLPIDALGYYEDADFGRQELSHLVKGRGAPGDVVPVTVWRDGARRTVPLILGGNPDATALVPENVAGERAEYLVAGGFVLRELDATFLRALGNEWRAKNDPRLLHEYLAGGDPHWQPGDRVVMLTAVLPDRINAGYQHFRSRIVTAVNGQPVRNLRRVFEVKDRDGSITSITLDGVGVDLALDPAELPLANARLTRQYRIPALEYRRPVAADPSPSSP